MTKEEKILEELKQWLKELGLWTVLDKIKELEKENQ